MAKLETNLKKIADQAPLFAAEALRQTADDIINLTKQITPVDTGLLRSSYKAAPVSESEVQVGSEVEYAPYVEYGTVNQMAQPHLTPAFHQAEATFRVRLSQAAQKVIE